VPRHIHQTHVWCIVHTTLHCASTQPWIQMYSTHTLVQSAHSLPLAFHYANLTSHITFRQSLTYVRILHQRTCCRAASLSVVAR
jgi:hypothetical protein